LLQCATAGAATRDLWRCLQTSLACHSERSVAAGEGGGGTESKNPVASERASILHRTGFFDGVPTRLRPLGTPLRMTAILDVVICKRALRSGLREAAVDAAAI